MTGISLESSLDPQLAVAIYGSNEYSYSVGDLLTTVCTQWVPCYSVVTLQVSFQSESSDLIYMASRTAFVWRMTQSVAEGEQLQL